MRTIDILGTSGLVFIYFPEIWNLIKTFVYYLRQVVIIDCFSFF